LNDQTRCYQCHGPLVGKPIPYAVGVINDQGGTGTLYVCSRECHNAAHRAGYGKRACGECGAPIPGEYDKPRGRRRQYCERKCQTVAERRRTRVWKAAARSIRPGKLEDIAAMQTDLRRLLAEIDRGALLDTPPVSARNLLHQYSRELDRHAGEVAEKQRAERMQENYRAFTEQTRELAAGKRREFDDYMKSAGVDPAGVDMPRGLLA